MFGNDETYYAYAAQEIGSGQVRPGLWAKALAETGYDEQLARARYIKLRVRAMKAEVAEGSRFMVRAKTTLRVSAVLGIVCVLLWGLVWLGVVSVAVARHYGWLEAPQVAEVVRSATEQGRATRRQTKEEAAELDSLITKIENAYPALNPASPSFDKERADRVVKLWEAYELEGYSRTSALLKAVKEQG